MQPHQSADDDWRGLAEVLARAADLDSAFDAIVAEVSRRLRAPSCIVEHGADGWRIRAQARGGLPLALAALPPVFDAIEDDTRITALDFCPIGLGRWMSVPLGSGGRSTATLVVAGHGEALERAVTPLVVWIPFVLRSICERRGRDKAARFAVDTYAFARRAGRPGEVDAVAQRIVDQVAQSIDAERISLAIYRPNEDCLAVVASSGYASEQVRHARIGHGAWVMGHVYATGRPVVVSDVARIRSAPRTRHPYRTSSFAAVPVIAGQSKLGVLSATDKRDGSVFDREDALALRTFSGVAALAIAAARTETEVDRLSRAVNIDPLTGLFNRPYFDARLHEEIERAKRSNGSLALLMADVDDFKSINDSYGHPSGDVVLEAVGHVLKSAVRVFDVCARYGGDEFAILMPTSDSASAMESATRIRRRLVDQQQHDDRLDRARRFTISIGAAALEPLDTPADVIRRADRALYMAKAAGKDTVRAIERSAPPEAGGPLWPSTCDE